MASLIKKVAPIIVACFGCTNAFGEYEVLSTWWLAYASELFGPGHDPIEWPDRYPQQIIISLFGDTDWPSTTVDESTLKWGSENAGTAEVTIALTGAATFAGNVTGLTWDPNAMDNWHEDDDNNPDTPANNDEDDDPNTLDVANETEPVTTPGTVASIVAGGRKGDNFVTIRIEAAGDTSASDIPSNATQAAAAQTRNTAAWQYIYLPVPRLANLEALAGASGEVESTWERSEALKVLEIVAESRLVSGSFPDEPRYGGPNQPAVLVRALDWLTLDTSKDGTRLIGIDAEGDDAAFHHLERTPGEVKTHDDGTIRLGSVTISTSQVHPLAHAVGEREAADIYQIRNAGGTDTGVVYRPAQQASSAFYFSVLDLDGQWLSNGRIGLRGVFRVAVEGTRGLFNDGDVLFVDYDRDGKMGSGEELVLDGAKGVGTSLSIDFDALESFKNPTWGRYEGVFDVYYRPGGKQPYNHGAEIKLTASVDYSDPSAIDEKDVTATTTFKFEGVESEVLAYAIPFAGNGKGDVANVRVRCENVAGCRVFVECTGDDAVRSFGEAGVLEHEKLMKWDSARLESIIGATGAASRHSCRILSKGKVRVQQLTRDGASNTLVNNTYVGG